MKSVDLSIEFTFWYRWGMQIDHDPNEPPVDRTPGPWKWVIPIVLVTIALNAYSNGIDWLSFACGGGAGIVLTAWIIEITGNKVPASWRRNSSSPSRR